MLPTWIASGSTREMFQCCFSSYLKNSQTASLTQAGTIFFFDFVFVFVCEFDGTISFFYFLPLSVTITVKTIFTASITLIVIFSAPEVFCLSYIRTQEFHNFGFLLITGTVQRSWSWYDNFFFKRYWQCLTWHRMMTMMRIKMIQDGRKW